MLLRVAPMSGLWRVVASTLLAAAFFFVWPPRAAHAQLQLDGRWQQSALREEFTVQQWLPNGCGPTPTSNSSGGGEIVAIRLEGDELAIVGGGKVYRSNQCYDPMPTLQRETHSRDANGKTWRTRCTTPANDPRKAILNTLVIAQNDTHIDLVETGRYEIVVADGRCVADVKRTRAYDLVPEEKPAVSASAAPPPPTAEPKPPPEPKPSACESPGDPARLEVRPSKKLVRPGETFQFRASVVDAKGCGTGTRTTWKLATGAPAGVTVDANGKVTIGKDVPEGSFAIAASAAEKETKVSIEVTSAAHYDDLLASSGLNAAGENDAAAVVNIASTSIGAGEGRVEDRSKQRRNIFIGIVGGVLLVLGILAAVLRGRSRRASAIENEAKDRHEAEVAGVLERRRVQQEQHAIQRRAHEESLAAAATAKAKTKADAIAHAARINAANAAVQVSQPPPSVEGAPKRGKICPTCGDRFPDGGGEYCGKDGTALVLLN